MAAASSMKSITRKGCVLRHGKAQFRRGIVADVDAGIDGIVAVIMAIGRAMVAQKEPQPEYSLHFV